MLTNTKLNSATTQQHYIQHWIPNYTLPKQRGALGSVASMANQADPIYRQRHMLQWEFAILIIWIVRVQQLVWEEGTSTMSYMYFQSNQLLMQCWVLWGSLAAQVVRVRNTTGFQPIVAPWRTEFPQCISLFLYIFQYISCIYICVYVYILCFIASILPQFRRKFGAQCTACLETHRNTIYQHRNWYMLSSHERGYRADNFSPSLRVAFTRSDSIPSSLRWMSS